MKNLLYSDYDQDQFYTLEQFHEDTQTTDDEHYHEWINSQWELDREFIYENALEQANQLLDSKKYTRVDGINRRWNGTTDIDLIIQETNLEDIIRNYINPDYLEIYHHDTHVTLVNIHHDGTNSYDLYPFDFNDLTKRELLDRTDKEDYEWYGAKLYKATKQDLIDYQEEVL